MSKKSLNTMVASGDKMEIGGVTYTVRPLTIKYVNEFIEDNLSLGSQMFTIANPDSYKKLEKWIPRILSLEDKEVVLKDIEDWTIVDLRKLITKACDLSG